MLLNMGGAYSPSLCVACRGSLLPDSRFCGRCGAPQPGEQGGALVSSPQAQTLPLDHGRRRAPRRVGRTLGVALVVAIVVGGAAVAGVLVVRRGGGHTPFLACPGGLCPRFPIDRAARLEAVDAAFGRARLMLPRGALREARDLTIAAAPAGTTPPVVYTPDGREVAPTVIGPVVRLGPDGQRFEEPVRLEVPFEPAKVDADDQVAVITWSGGLGERLQPISVDRDAGFVIVETRHFSDVVAVIDPGATVTFTPPPCPPPVRRAVKCPWTPDGYAVGECTEGFCWDGGPQGFLACKQEVVAAGIAVGENRNPYCAQGTPIWDRCTGVLLRCAP